MNNADIQAMIGEGLHPAWCKVHAADLRTLAEGFARRRDWGGSHVSDKAPQYVKTLAQLAAFLVSEAETGLNDIQTLRAFFEEFRQRHTSASTEEECQLHILWMSEKLGRSRSQLAGDRRSFKRWFDADAVAERYQRRVAEQERRVGFLLIRLGSVAQRFITLAARYVEPIKLWRRLELEQLIRPLFSYATVELRRAAFECLSTAMRALPYQMRELSVTDSSLRYIYRVALEPRQDVWVQCEALNLLSNLSNESFKTALHRRLSRPAGEDDIFVRRQAVRILCKSLKHYPELVSLYELAMDDPSPAVRQLLPAALPHLHASLAQPMLVRLSQLDPCAQVRASALLMCAEWVIREDLYTIIEQVLAQVLREERDAFVLRVALHVLTTACDKLRTPTDDSRCRQWWRALKPALAQAHQRSTVIKVRRWISQTRELMWVKTEPQAMALIAQIQPSLAGINPGCRLKLKRGPLLNVDEHTLGRSLSVMAQEDFGLDLDDHGGKRYLMRGHRFAFRSWRFLHEFLHPSTDKRQAHRHTIGRLFFGRIRAPSRILCELAQTKVPGEPLHIGEEDGARAYLPLVDEVISVLEGPAGTRKPVCIYTSEGVTRLQAPTSFTRRLRAYWLLSTRFVHYARLRNWREGESHRPDAYMQALRGLGFTVSFEPHQDADGLVFSDASVQRFFPAFLGFSFDGLGELGERVQDYFFSVYENTVAELVVFLALAMSWFFGRHIFLNYTIRKARKSIPLVIGGWGTRGKSGTERIKAALFNALGYGVVSKTTGCEAMFLHAYPQGRLREMFLFRPYDKATIWEQADVMRLSRHLGCEVFLWECMALTPAYVDILQRKWMRDDIATITNAYPDHEDLQGPAGYNIPQVMGEFIPEHSLLITSEDQMLPIIAQAARKRKTPMISVGWLEAGLLAPDILDRFPYAEHPNNIALVLRMAFELGIAEDFALKEMADRVVPDLGVLKKSPLAHIRGRKLEFINGMSANERIGCLGNWQRMNFSDQDPYQEPGVWLGTVVNNRADRVARSRVFASILVTDVKADLHVLIGTNLDGLQNYIDEEWALYQEEINLWPDMQDGEGADPLHVLDQGARTMRVPYQEAHVRGLVAAMFEGLGIQAPQALLDAKALEQCLSAADQGACIDSVLSYLTRWLDDVRAYQTLADKIGAHTGAPDDTLNNEFRALMRRWFERKLLVIEDSHASGEQIIQAIVEATPVGLRHRVMGVQNIKGTGLDFVYRWQAWETCSAACDALDSREPQVVEGGLKMLASFRDYGILCEERVRKVVERVRHSTVAQSELFQAELTVILSNLDSVMQRLNAKGPERGKPVWLLRLVAGIEALLDTGDAVTRRKTANRIYRDLAQERIGHERAAMELRALNERQKGGWLKKRLNKWLRDLAAR